MVKFDLSKIEKNIEVYKYMLQSVTELYQYKLGVDISENIDSTDNSLLDYMLTISVKSLSDPDLNNVIQEILTIIDNVENFISEYQLREDGKIVRSKSKTNFFIGPLLLELNYSLENEELLISFEYHVETLQVN